MNTSWKKIITNKINEKKAIFNAPMAEETSFKAGGVADALVHVSSKSELIKILKALAVERIPYIIMGNGSNILVRDGGYRGVIVKVGEGISQISVDGEELVAGSGALLSVVARAAMNNSLTGMEFASGIPGSIGGAVFMNAGAYDGEICDILNEAVIITKDGKEEKKVLAKDLNLGYRYSAIQETNDVVVEARFSLKAGDKDQIYCKMKELTERRNIKQPVDFPSAGSFFKRPTGFFAGKLISDAGLKGLSVGDAQVSELHCGFIINKGKATASDIITLMNLVQAAVMENSGIKLEPEVRIIGEDICIE